MTLTKETIVNTLQNHLGLPKMKSMEMVETTLEIMKKTLESGEDVLISGFGKFCLRDKNVRIGRNPKSGEAAPIRARRVVTFKASGVLRDKMNRNTKKKGKR